MAKYIARPVTVKAKRIIFIEESTIGGRWLKLEDGTRFCATDEMLARMTPEEGDFVVWQEDGYVYLNPRHVFERKYRPAEEAEHAK